VSTFDPKGSKTLCVKREREKIRVLNLSVNGVLFTRRKEEKE